MNKASEFNPLTAALSSKWQYARGQLTASAPVSAAAAIATAPVATTATTATTATALSTPRVVATGSATCASLYLARRLTLPGKGIRTDVTERRLHGVGLRAARALVASVAALIATFLTEASAVAAELAGGARSQAGACISAISAIADSSAPAIACPAAVAALRRIAAVQRRLQVQRVVPLLIFLILRIARLGVFRHGLHTLTGTRTAATTS